MSRGHGFWINNELRTEIFSKPFGWLDFPRPPDRGTPDSSGIRMNRVWGCRIYPAFRWQRPLVPCHRWPHFQILFAEQRARN
jgi:hypothetical protein